MRHYLLIEGANYNHLNLSRYIKISLICLRDTIEKINASLYENIFIVDNLNDISQLNKYHIEDYKFDFVYSFSEFNQLYAGRISDYYNIPGISEKKIQFLQNKYCVRDILRKNKLSCIDSEIVQNLEEVKRFILKEGFPIIIKPNRGIGGKDIHKITNFTELSKMTIDTNTLVEKFIEGKEYSVESFTYENESSVFTVTEKIKDKNLSEVGHIIPALLDTEIVKKIQFFVSKMNKILRLTNTVNHTEIIISKDGAIELVETHCRMGGDMIGKLMENSFDYNIVDYWGQSIRENKQLTQKPKWNGLYSSIHYVFPEKPGILKEIKIPNDLDSLNISILKNVGDHVVNVGNTNRVLSLIYESPSYSEVSSISKKLNEIEIEVD